MALHIYEDQQITKQLSEGDMSAADFSLLEGQIGSYSDKKLFVANENTHLAADISGSNTVISFAQSGRFANGQVIVIDEEQMLITSGGGTAAATVQRGYNDTAPVGHAHDTVVYSGYYYLILGVVGMDVSPEYPVPSSWCQLALTQEGLSQAVPGEAVSWGQAPIPISVKLHNQTLSFWRRVTCPAGTPVQYKTNIKWRVWGIELPILPAGLG